MESRLVSRSFSSMDGLRGYMAWSVVLSHVVAFAGLNHLPSAFLIVFANGSRAVNVFIMLSGFVITHLCMNKAEAYRPYLVRRAMRIIPIYLFCLFLAILFMPQQIEMHTAPWVIKRDVYHDGFMQASYHFWPYLLLHITLLHGLIPDTVFPYSAWAFLGPAWSLSLEWQFYLLAPFIIYCMRRSVSFQVMTTLALLSGLIYFQWYLPGLHWAYPSMLLLSIHFFLIGIVSRLWLEKLVDAAIWMPFAIYVLLVLTFHSLWWELTIWFVTLGAVLRECRDQGPGGVVQRSVSLLLTNRSILALGRASYSTYLIHIVLFSVILAIGRYFGFSSQRSTLFMILGSLVLLVPLSLVLYSYIEKPFISLGQRLVRNERVGV